MVFLWSRKKIGSILKTKMLCPIFRMAFSQKYVPSAVCYIWSRQWCQLFVTDPYFWLCESNLIEHEVMWRCLPTFETFENALGEAPSFQHIYHCCGAGLHQLWRSSPDRVIHSSRLLSPLTSASLLSVVPAAHLSLPQALLRPELFPILINSSGVSLTVLFHWPLPALLSAPDFNHLVTH